MLTLLTRLSAGGQSITALTSENVVDLRRIELLTSPVRGVRSTN